MNLQKKQAEIKFKAEEYGWRLQTILQMSGDYSL